MMDILTFRLNQFLENVLSSCQLWFGYSICRICASELLAKVVAISRSVQLTAQTKNIKHTVYRFGNLESLSNDNKQCGAVSSRPVLQAALHHSMKYSL